ncbi:hypothetical protein GCM10023340_28640 [Nocardioides marinquilinus]|uniref:Uncharacterized protein n=1 Tax=Nocardioides marinquilinus TaxID=1210400 RepID=A0ABP9PR89_9ACTN
MTDEPTGSDRLSKAEINKDSVQAAAEAAATTVGEVATIVTTAVRDVAHALGNLATEIFEIRDSARRAGQDADPSDMSDGSASEQA